MSDFIKSIGASSLRENGDLVNSCDEYNLGQNYSFDDFQTIHRYGSSDPFFLKDVYSNKIFVKLYDFLVYGGDDEFFVCDCLCDPLDHSDIRFAINGLYPEIAKKDIDKNDPVLLNNISSNISISLANMGLGKVSSSSTLGAFSKGQIVQVKDFDLPFYVLSSSLLQLSSNKYTLFYDLFCLDYELIKLGVFSVRRIFAPASLVRSFKFDKNFSKYVIALYAFVYKNSLHPSLDLSSLIKKVFGYSGEKDIFSFFVELLSDATASAGSGPSEMPIFI